LPYILEGIRGGFGHDPGCNHPSVELTLRTLP